MSKKKGTPIQHRTLGIICILAILIIVILVKIFSAGEVVSRVEMDTKDTSNREILKEKEDSVYRSRRTERRTYERRRDSHSVTREELQTYYATEAPAPKRKPLMVELNSADTTTLMLLHGIGPTFARRIVRYRERLGGYVNREQLLEVYGFTPQLLEHITPYVRLEEGGARRRLAVNSAGLKELVKHPYMDYYFARDLVNLRSQGNTFSSAEDLRAIPSCTDTMLNRLLPYLDFTLEED